MTPRPTTFLTSISFAADVVQLIGNDQFFLTGLVMISVFLNLNAYSCQTMPIPIDRVTKSCRLSVRTACQAKYMFIFGRFPAHCSFCAKMYRLPHSVSFNSFSCSTVGRSEHTSSYQLKCTDSPMVCTKDGAFLASQRRISQEIISKLHEEIGNITNQTVENKP